MIYVLLAVSVTFFGARVIDFFFISFNDENIFKLINKLFISLFFIIVIFLIFENSLISYSSLGDARYNLKTIAFLKEARSSLFQKGILLALGVSISLYILLISFLKNKIKKTVFITILISITLVDLGIVNSEFLNLKSPKDFNKLFKSNSRIDHMVRDSDHFRIYPADNIGTNRYSYWNLESIAGYRPIKLRNYQDIMDAGGLKNPKNIKYVEREIYYNSKKNKNSNFTKVPDINGLYENKNVLPKSWIVNKVISVKSHRESLYSTLASSFKPNTQAILINYDGKFLTEKSSGTSSIIKKSENRIVLTTESENGGILVLSGNLLRTGLESFC